MSAARCYDEQGNPLTRYVMDACGVSRTLVVRVRGRGSGRVSMAGMTCYRLGEQPRPICAIREYRVRKASRRASAGGTPDPIVRARVRFGGPIVLVCDNVRLYLTAGICATPGLSPAARVSWPMSPARKPARREHALLLPLTRGRAVKLDQESAKRLNAALVPEPASPSIAPV